MSLTRMDITTFEQNLIGLGAGGRQMMAMIEKLTNERATLLPAVKTILTADKTVFGGLCDDAFDGVEVQSDELTGALKTLRKWFANTEDA